MKENKDLKPAYVQKADMALSDLTGGGVTLFPEQLEKFILVQIKNQVMMEKCRVTTMSRETQDIPKMTTFGSQVWFPGTESTALAQAQRVKPGFDHVQLTSKEVVCQIDFPRYVLQNQVEGPDFKNTMIGYLGIHTKRDIENLIINGNTATGSNSLLLMFDGILALATSNTYTAAGALSSTILDRTMLTEPEEFDSSPGLAYFTNKVGWASYHRELASRGTPLGDINQTGMGAALPYSGYQVYRVPMFPSTLGIGGNETALMFMDPKNFVFAFHENVEMQSEYNIRERTWTIVVTARFAQNFEHEPAVVKTTGVTGA